MEDALAAYFGPDDFADAIFAHLRNKTAIRLQEIERERAEINARHEALQRARLARTATAAPAHRLRLATDQDREGVL